MTFNTNYGPQQKLKEEKEAKRATLDSRHQFLFGTVATKLRITESEVEDFIIEGTQVRKPIFTIIAVFKYYLYSLHS